jgi:hypothetical protein
MPGIPSCNPKLMRLQSDALPFPRLPPSTTAMYRGDWALSTAASENATEEGERCQYRLSKGLNDSKAGRTHPT